MRVLIRLTAPVMEAWLPLRPTLFSPWGAILTCAAGFTDSSMEL